MPAPLRERPWAAPRLCWSLDKTARLPPTLNGTRREVEKDVSGQLDLEGSQTPGRAESRRERPGRLEEQHLDVHKMNPLQHPSLTSASYKGTLPGEAGPGPLIRKVTQTACSGP